MEDTNKKRKNYTIKYKLDILNQYKPNVPGHGWLSLSRKYGIGTSVLRAWHEQKSKLVDALNNNYIKTRVSRRLTGGGRKLQFEEIEKEVLDWVLKRNSKGLRVKDKYIQLKAQQICQTLQYRNEDPKLKNFKASSGWCERFKNRHNLVSRRQTTTKNIPHNVNSITANFLREIHNLIEEKKFKKCNIINIDQVPRYFEAEPKTTITSKGTREVLMKKASTAHKRFTTTLAITLEGKFLKPHLLFSNLKRLPKVNNKCIVDINKTGMFGEEILKNYIRDIILKRPQTNFNREPTLLIIDSYGSHVKLQESKYLEKCNISVVLIPPNLTGLLQPLDVAVNRSFQESYNSRYDTYIANALDNEEFQTRQGNPKIPNYEMVSNWIVDWVESKNENFIKNAFMLCGIVPKEEFKITFLHSALQQVLSEDFDYDSWLVENPLLCAEQENYFQKNGIFDLFWPLSSATSFFECINTIKNKNQSFQIFVTEYVAKIINFIKNNPETVDLLDKDDEHLITQGYNSSTNSEIYAVAQIESWNIKITTLDKECCETGTFTYTVSSPKKDIHLVKRGEYYGLIFST